MAEATPLKDDALAAETADAIFARDRAALHVRGTGFQLWIRQALLRIPAGAVAGCEEAARAQKVGEISPGRAPAGRGRGHPRREARRRVAERAKRQGTEDASAARAGGVNPVASPADAPSAARVALALGTVYLIWGSTYLAIRFAVETLPPFLMAGTRFLVAGAILYGWRRAVGFPRPTPAQWRAAAVVGGLMLLGGNGGVVWAEQWVESGTAALIVAAVPLWMVLLDWLRPGGRAPAPAVWVGILVGLGGVALLLGGPQAGPHHLVGWIVLVLASVAWAAGSLYSRSAALPAPLLATGMQMLAGGALLVLAGTLTGELAAVDPGGFSRRSVLALAYLVVFGSLLGYSAYVWLLRVTPPALASTYAYVNPVVAVFLGWLLAGERLTTRVLMASAIIVGGVALITTARAHDRRRAARRR